MNVFLFFPLGLTMPYSLMNNRRKVLITILFALFLTCTIEFIQFICKSGNAELSDILMNTLGAVIGATSYMINTKIIERIDNKQR